MTRFIILSVVIAFLNAVTPFQNKIGPLVMIHVNSSVQNTFELRKSFYEVQNPFAVQDSSGWLNIFGIDNISESKEANPVKLTIVPSNQVGGIIHYIGGKRISNDRLVGTNSDGKRCYVPQGVTLTLRYPKSGEGAKITYVEIVVDQSSNVGQAQIISGGIGQHSITIDVKAKNTLWFFFTAKFYGI